MAFGQKYLLSDRQQAVLDDQRPSENAHPATNQPQKSTEQTTPAPVTRRFGQTVPAQAESVPVSTGLTRFGRQVAPTLAVVEVPVKSSHAFKPSLSGVSPVESPMNRQVPPKVPVPSRFGSTRSNGFGPVPSAHRETFTEYDRRGMAITREVPTGYANGELLAGAKVIMLSEQDVPDVLRKLNNVLQPPAPTTSALPRP